VRLIRGGFATIREHLRAYVVINVVFYGLLIVAMGVAAVFPQLHESLWGLAEGESGGPGILGAVDRAYQDGDVLVAAALTFVVNLTIGALLTVTLPSFVIPFFGVGFVIYRVVQWGILFTPAGPEAGVLIPHMLTLVIEGQAYVVAALAVWLHGRMFLMPRRSGLPSRWVGYAAGLGATVRLYPLVVVLLVVGAVYEAIEVIYFIPLLT